MTDADPPKDFFALWEAANTRERSNVATLPPPQAGDLSAYVATVCQGVTEAANGTRNDTLNRAAYTLGRIVAAGQLHRADAYLALKDAGHASGLEDLEIENTIESGLKAGEAEPRALEVRAVTTTTTLVTEAPDVTAVDRTSWWPRPIGTIIADRGAEPDPTHLARTDGHRLFYSGRVNGLLGESESGKTWVALHSVAQSLLVAEHCLYLDFEDSAKGIDGRLRLLGVSDERLDLLHYANPDEALGLAQNADLTEALATSGYQLIILDGVNAAMTTLGLNPDSSQNDATVFVQRVLRPLANTGAAVVTIDHVPKNKETRGKGGIGAQAKRAMTRGCALSVEVLRPFGPGVHGELKLTVDKDTPGKVRGVSAAAKHAGVVYVDSSTDRVDIKIEAPDMRSADERGPFRPTHLMEKVSRWLETVPDGASGNAIETGVGGNREYVREAVNRLVEEGHVTRSTGARGAVIHTLLNPYQEL